MKQKKNRSLLLAGVICILSLVVMVLALTFGGGEKALPFTPPPFDQTVQAGIPEVLDDLGWSELDAKGSILGETGLVRPGEYVPFLCLNTTPKSGVAITLKLMAYEPETYHSAGTVVLNTTVR